MTLIEARSEVGLETSFANGSLITPSMSDPWAAPGIPWKIVKWLGREDAPFSVASPRGARSAQLGPQIPALL